MDILLQNIFSNVKYFLTFAESKSGMLVAANGLVIFGILNLIDNEPMTFLVKCTISLIFLLLIISLFLSLSTFVPKLKMPWLIKTYNKSNSDNLIYFGDIQKYTPKSYLTALQKSKSLTEDITDYQIMLSDQIIINSVIANYKFEIFALSIRFFLSAIIIFAIFLLAKIWS